MRRHNLSRVLTMLAIMALSVAVPVKADPIVVSYTPTLVTTSDGDVWLLNFSVTNNLLRSSVETTTLYFFGVDVPGAFPLDGFRRGDEVVPGLAPGWQPFSDTWTNSTLGGSSRVYNLSWFEPIDRSRIRPGETRDGFIAYPVAVVPSSVNWFAFGLTGGGPGSGFGQGTVVYTGPDAFNSPTVNPGFEGTATAASIAPTPEPATLVLMGLGLAAAVARGRASRQPHLHC